MDYAIDNHCAQILLTRSDLESEKRVFNAKNTLNMLFEMKAIPIINENDTVSTEEIQFGDNDNLAAMVANLIEADFLVLLTDQVHSSLKIMGFLFLLHNLLQSL